MYLPQERDAAFPSRDPGRDSLFKIKQKFKIMVGGIRWNSDMDLMCTLDVHRFDLMDCLGTCAMND